MADSVVRLKVESQEYDNKLKRATEGLTRYADGCRKAGGTLEVVEKETLDFVRAIGQMETTSRSATGKLGEMKKAFTDLSMQYRQLTDAEKQSPYGKALAESLDQLKGRIKDNQVQLNSIGSEISNTGGFMEQLTSKLTVNIDAMKLFNVGLQAASAALGVAKDAFFASEATVDEWGRVVDSSKSLYEGFLTALNTGDISGYLGRIDQIVQAARAAYNEIDRLGTLKTIQAPQISAQQTENDRIRMMIQTGRYIAPIDGRKASMQSGQQLSAEQIRVLERKLQNGTNQLVGLVGNEVKQTTKAIDAIYARQGAELGMSVKEFRKGTSSMAEFDRRIAGAEAYERYEREHTTYDSRAVVGHRDNTVNPFAQFKGWDAFRVDGQRYNDLVKLIQQRDQQASSAYSMQSQAYRTMNRAEGVTLRSIMGGGGGGTGGGGGVDPISTILASFDKAMLKSAAGAASLKPEDVLGPSDAWTAYTDAIAGGFEKTADEMSNLTEFTKDFDPLAEYLKKDAILAKQQAAAFDMAAQSAQNLGAAFASLDDPAARAAGTVISAIANIALGFGQAVASAGSMGPWAWLAYVAAGTAALATTISTVHSLTGYAEGGIVKGNSYSGDNLDGSSFGINAGELVLNRAQQASLASQLTDQQQGGEMTARISGEQIVLIADRYLRRTGRGRLVTWK